MRWMTLLAVTAVLALAGCGGSDEKSSGSSGSSSNSNSNSSASSGGGGGESGGGGETLKLAADKSALKFDKTSLTAKAGKVTLEMANPSQLPHAVAIKGNGVDVDGKTVGNGETSTASTDLKAGTYTFYCPVPGHEAAGMKGTLTVN
jgi:plastocyanin